MIVINSEGLGWWNGEIDVLVEVGHGDAWLSLERLLKVILEFLW
jgi:hypothetical protein